MIFDGSSAELREGPRWFAVVDARGRVAWTHKGDEETSLLVIASHSTPLPYLAVLRQEQIPYLIAGARQVDLSAALAKIRTQLGARCLVSQAGGGLNDEFAISPDAGAIAFAVEQPYDVEIGDITIRPALQS